MTKEWQEYEKQVLRHFQKKYPENSIEFDQKIVGRFSRTKRQVDILITSTNVGTMQLGIFDCKMFNKKVDVKTIDSMVGFMDDLNANFGGIITTKGFTTAAKNRAKEGRIDLRVINFKSPKTAIDQFYPSLDFSDPRNSSYIGIL